jgi:hypothetical protein
MTGDAQNDFLVSIYHWSFEVDNIFDDSHLQQVKLTRKSRKPASLQVLELNPGGRVYLVTSHLRKAKRFKNIIEVIVGHLSMRHEKLDVSR